MKLKSIKMTIIRTMLVSVFLTSLMFIANAQNNGITATTEQQPKLMPDAKTEYFDSTGSKINGQTFMELMKSGKYSWAPVIEDGRVKSISLKTLSGKVGIGAKAPDFKLTDMAGKTYELKSLSGKVLVLNFWFTTCQPCIAEMSEMNRMVEKYKTDPNVIFLAPTYESQAMVRSFLAKVPFKFSVVTDAKQVINAYEISSYPTSLVINTHGEIAFILVSNDGTNVMQIDNVIQALKNK